VIELAEVFRRHGPAYLATYGERILPSHRRALKDIVACRTPAMGGHLFLCESCGHERYAYHSCRNRSCPKCQGDETRDWLEKRRGELLPVTYFHVVLTVSHALNDEIRSHQKPLYGLLMKAAATSVIDLARDPKYLGATVGVLAVLHTWGRSLGYHTHVHCIVTGGGLSPDRQKWLWARGGYLVSVKALSKMFRGRFMDLARKALPDVAWPRRARRQKWVVWCKPPFKQPAKLLDYLGRYIHRVAITNARIVSMGDDHVRFRYKPVDQPKWRTMKLTPEEFIRRFLQHVPPRGFHKVRYYGLWAPANRAWLRRTQLLLSAKAPDSETDETPEVDLAMSVESDDSMSEADDNLVCPRCGGRVICVRIIAKASRGPP